jgi:hypothetical protein
VNPRPKGGTMETATLGKHDPSDQLIADCDYESCAER